MSSSSVAPYILFPDVGDNISTDKSGKVVFCFQIKVPFVELFALSDSAILLFTSAITSTV